MKIKLLIVTCILFLMVGAIIVANTRFWDTPVASNLIVVPSGRRNPAAASEMAAAPRTTISAVAERIESASK